MIRLVEEENIPRFSTHCRAVQYREPLFDKGTCKLLPAVTILLPLNSLPVWFTRDTSCVREWTPSLTTPAYPRPQPCQLIIFPDQIYYQLRILDIGLDSLYFKSVKIFVFSYFYFDSDTF